MKYRVKNRHDRSFDKAPQVGAGDVVTFVRHDSKNPGWFFGETEGGVDGYFPSEWFDISERNRKATAQRPYNAMELTAEIGEIIESLDSAAGWLFVRAEDGRVGWVPLEKIEIVG
jgi:hypothetical protein